MAGVRRSLILSFGEKYSILLINIVATVILARLLTPAETGLYSVAAGIINIAQTLRDFGVGNYIIQESELTRRRLSTALGISIILGFTLAAIFISAAGSMATAFHEPRLKLVILIMSLNFVLVAFAAIGTARLHRDMNFRAGLRIGIVAALVHAGTSIAMASHGYGAVGMAWASVLGIVVYLVGNYICYAEDIFLLPRLGEWRRILSFGVLSSGGYVLQEVGQRAADVVVGRFLGFGAAGFFSRANGLISLFQQALMNAITPVALSALALLNREGEQLQTPFLRFMGYTTTAAWPLLGMMALLALPIIRVAFGSQWVPAVETAQILCLAAGFAVLGRVAITLFTATGTVRRLFTVQIVGIPVLVCAISLGASVSIETAAIGTVAGSIVHALYSLHQVNRTIGTSWRQICGALGVSLLVTGGSLAAPSGVIFYYGLSIDHFWPQTIAAGLAGLASWIACIFALRHPFRDEILLGARHLWTMLIRAAVGGEPSGKVVFPIEMLLSPPPHHGPVLTVVVDTEEEFSWDKDFDAGATSVRNISCLVLAQDIMDRYGAVPTYVIDYPVASSPEACAILRAIADSGRCEIGAHLHPWVNPPHESPVDAWHSYPANLPPALELSKLKALTDIIADGFGRRPIVYKAGRYGVGTATTEILATLGYQVDVSVVPHTNFSNDLGPDFTRIAAIPFQTLRGIAVLPLSVGFVGSLSRLGRIFTRF